MSHQLVMNPTSKFSFEVRQTKSTMNRKITLCDVIGHRKMTPGFNVVKPLEEIYITQHYTKTEIPAMRLTS